MVLFFLSWHGRTARVRFHFKAGPLGPQCASQLPPPLDPVTEDADPDARADNRAYEQGKEHPVAHIRSPSSGSPPSPFFFSSWMLRPRPRISLQSTSKLTGVPASRVLVPLTMLS